LSVVASADQAEDVVKMWLEKKFDKKLKKTTVTQVSLTEGIWDVKAEVELRSGSFSTVRQIALLKVDSATANVVGYSENPGPRPSNSG
jgi:hypothetical protein